MPDLPSIRAQVQPPAVWRIRRVRGEAKANPAQFAKDAKAEQSLPHDQRPQEQRANAAQKAYTKEIKQAVKQIEKDRKKENQ